MMYPDMAIRGLNEEDLQEFLTTAFQNDGGVVRNNHDIDPRSENGADLDVTLDKDRILVAVKVKPKKSDIDQLNRLALRSGEGKLEYAHSQPTTGEFHNRAIQIRDKVHFLTGEELHEFLVKGECMAYVNRVLEMHPLLQEYADTLALIWTHKRVTRSDVVNKREIDFLFKMKDEVLKKRAGVTMVYLHCDRVINSMEKRDPMDFVPLLNEVLLDLDLVQVFSGEGLFTQFEEVAHVAPHLLSGFWSAISRRTYWKEFVKESGALNTFESVSQFAKRFWLLPNKGSVGKAKNLAGNAIGFLSGLRDSLECIARCFKDMDDIIDGMWAGYYTDSESEFE